MRIQTSCNIVHGLHQHNSELMGIAYYLPIIPDLENKLSFAFDCLVPQEEAGYNCYCFELELLFNQTIQLQLSNTYTFTTFRSDKTTKGFGCKHRARVSNIPSQHQHSTTYANHTTACVHNDYTATPSMTVGTAHAQFSVMNSGAVVRERDELTIMQ